MADITPMRTPAETTLVELFPAVRASLPGNAAVAGQRDAAFAAFRAQGLPHRRVEAYKYTDLRTLLRNGASDADITSALAAIWQRRADRYSELRSAQAPDDSPGTRRVEMSYIGG